MSSIIHMLFEEGFELSAELQNLLIQKCQFVLQSEDEDLPVNIVFTGDEQVRELNRDFRDKDKTTDVLSFPWEEDGDEEFLDDEEQLLGELYISIPQVERQAPRFDTTFEEEMERVVIHGLLHLLDYDHIKASDRKVMRAKEEFYLGRSPYAEKE